MLSGDLYERSMPRVELDQRARDARLGLERAAALLGVGDHDSADAAGGFPAGATPAKARSHPFFGCSVLILRRQTIRPSADRALRRP